MKNIFAITGLILLGSSGAFAMAASATSSAPIINCNTSNFDLDRSSKDLLCVNGRLSMTADSAQIKTTTDDGQAIELEIKNLDCIAASDLKNGDSGNFNLTPYDNGFVVNSTVEACPSPK
jgi:hypothetical protein